MIRFPSLSPSVFGVARAALLAPLVMDAQIITFEDYTLGDINAPEGSPVGFAVTNRDGWSNSTSSGGGVISNVGGLEGGQYLTVGPLSTIGGKTMIAARAAAIPVGSETSFSFDLRFASFPGGAREGMAGFAQAFPGNSFSNADAGILFGQTGPTSFGYRAAGFGGGTSVFAPSFENEWQIPTPVGGNWYRVSATIGAEAGGERPVTLSIYDYDSSTVWATETVQVPLARFGAVAPEDSAGIVARISRNDANDAVAGGIDNVNFSAIPEPSTYAMIFGFAGLALAVFRRRRKV